MDIRSKLAMYKEDKPNKKQTLTVSGKDIHDIIPGSVVENIDGCFYQMEYEYPLTHIHGGYSLGDIRNVNFSTLQNVFPDIDRELALEDILFLDTETTGLSGGTGTVAFLVGAGYFENNRFVLRQYFMRDYNEEPAMLRELGEVFKGCRALATFNGKSFDWNLLKSRFVFNRLPNGMSQPIHIDMLHPSRNLWKLKLESCRLISLEENILGEYRSGDIPGAQIPTVYFQYLDQRDAGQIKRVLEHNRLDIISMISLLVKIHSMIDNPLDSTDCVEELAGLGRIFQKSGEYDTVIECYTRCAQSQKSLIRDKALKELSLICKRKGDYERAVEYWKQMLYHSGGMNLFSLIELAKYYEHKARKIEYAIKVTLQAVKVLQDTGQPGSVFYRDAKKRLNRLKRKRGD